MCSAGLAGEGLLVSSALIRRWGQSHGTLAFPWEWEELIRGLSSFLTIHVPSGPPHLAHVEEDRRATAQQCKWWKMKLRELHFAAVRRFARCKTWRFSPLGKLNWFFETTFCQTVVLDVYWSNASSKQDTANGEQWLILWLQIPLLRRSYF